MNGGAKKTSPLAFAPDDRASHDGSELHNPSPPTKVQFGDSRSPLHKVLQPAMRQGAGLKPLNPPRHSNSHPTRYFDATKSTPISNIGAEDVSADEETEDAASKESAVLHKSRSDETLSLGLRAELSRSRQPRLSTLAASPQQGGNFRRARSDSKNDANWSQFLASMCSKHPELEQEIKRAATKESTDSEQGAQGEKDRLGADDAVKGAVDTTTAV